MAGIELLGVTKVFPDGAKAVDQLDLNVRDGELLVLVGPSGSGKTTTLRLIAGLEEPTSGTIRLGGCEVTNVAPRGRNVAMVFQGLGLYEHLTVRRNLAFGLEQKSGGWTAAIGGWLGLDPGSRKAIDQQVLFAAKLLRIEHLLGRKPGELSGGEQQRVALGRAIVRRPKAFLLDEPLSSLDPPARAVLRRELKGLQRELGVTTVYVTHDQSEAMALGDRIAVVRGGSLEQVGSPEEIYERPKNTFVAEFFGSAGMNFFQGALLRDVLPEAKRDERKLVVGIRPEHVTLSANLSGAISAQALTATVEQVEWLGDTTNVLLGLTDGSKWACKRMEKFVPRCGEQVRVHLPPEKQHWFDAETGERLDTGHAGA